VTLLGPSGCGKTTTLRAIAGLLEIDRGSIAIDGRDVTHVPIHRRDIGVVFQNNALFPHMTVAQNIAFGLRMRGVARDEQARRTAAALALVHLPDYGPRYPHQLSGGQQQRVAIARALVINPRVLLLDEPFAALDRKLREEMQMELRELTRRVGITAVFVTHDQEEALTMSDRIAVFNEGRIEQVGSPAEMYEHPRTAFVADFIGTSNVLSRNGRSFTVRPEKIRVLPADASDGELGLVRAAVYLGAVTRYLVSLDGGGELVALQQNLEVSSSDVRAMEGKRVRLAWRPDVEFAIKEGT
jgi:putative spermidine/putrescine transport system ATP-binding protein